MCTDAHRGHRSGAVERLDPAFLVDTENDRAIGRVEVAPGDVTHFVYEEGIVGELAVTPALASLSRVRGRSRYSPRSGAQERTTCARCTSPRGKGQESGSLSRGDYSSTAGRTGSMG